ncbi:MAG: DHH family phosphoesterase, partial [Clostridia bacterium]
FYIFFEKRGNKDQDAGKTIASHTFDYLSKVDYPALLVDNDGKISWFNTAYKAVYHETVIKNGEQYKPVDVGFDSLESLKKSDATVKIVRGERHFDLKSYQIETAHKKFQLIIWYDTTELFLANTELKNANVLVAYIVFDNISEISQGLQDKYHETGIKISKILDEWATSVHGIIKEYERDKYILFFEERYIETQISNKFEILDKISELSEDGAGGIPLTVSIGISRIHGSLQEKENTAKMALQLALQRGGAQAVIKTETDNDIYGGRTKTIQKLTKIKSRVIASKLVYEIKNSTNILIMAHKAPDFDALAACVGMARLVMYHKKKVNIVTDFSNVSLGIAKKLISNLKEYDDIFVDAVFGQDLLTPDTLLLIVDASNPAVFESPPIFQNASRIAIIDHHRQ